MDGSKGLTRRGLFAGATVAAGAAAAGVAQAHPNDTSPEVGIEPGWIGGTLRSVDGPRSATIEEWSGGITRIELNDGAPVLREGKASLADFEAGDDVSAQGDAVGDVFKAARFEAVYRLLETEVVTQRRNGVRSTAGDLHFNSDSKPFDGGALGHKVKKHPLNRLEGKRVIVSGRPRQSEGDFLALRVGVIVD